MYTTKKVHTKNMFAENEITLILHVILTHKLKSFAISLVCKTIAHMKYVRKESAHKKYVCRK